MWRWFKSAQEDERRAAIHDRRIYENAQKDPGTHCKIFLRSGNTICFVTLYYDCRGSNMRFILRGLARFAIPADTRHRLQHPIPKCFEHLAICYGLMYLIHSFSWWVIVFLIILFLCEESSNSCYADRKNGKNLSVNGREYTRIFHFSKENSRSFV